MVVGRTGLTLSWDEEAEAGEVPQTAKSRSPDPTLVYLLVLPHSASALTSPSTFNFHLATEA